MIYPEFLKKGDLIGICAPSAGVGKKLEDYENSLDTLRTKGYSIKETAHVRVNSERGGTAKERADELKELYMDPAVKFVMCAAGGDFLSEMLEYTDFEAMKEHPKFLTGMSDPTGLLFPYTAMCDVATIYGINGGGYDIDPMPEYMKNNLEIIAGNLIEQESFAMYMKTPGFLAEKIEFDTPVEWKSFDEEVDVTGRCIGGCIDVLKDLVGTRFDAAKAFGEKYKEDGLVWYFDNFSLGAEMFYRTLLQFKYAGWFDYAKAVLVGRVLFESSDTGMTYEDALRMALPEIPVVFQADVGHTIPHMTLVNGAIMRLQYREGKGKVNFYLQ